MTDQPELTPADPKDLESALSFALRYSGRKRINRCDDLMANLMAGHLVEHLARSGFMVMKKPPAPMHKAYDGPPKA